MQTLRKEFLLLMLLSGMAALCCESVWLRRLSLITGSAGFSAVVTLSLYMGGLGLGGLWAGRQRWRDAPFGYGVLEILVALWALGFPWMLQWWEPILQTAGGQMYSLLLAAPVLLPPAFLHGATLPAFGPSVRESKSLAALYAINTLGAVLGVLFSAFWWMPVLGIRGTEVLAASISGMVGICALIMAFRQKKATRVKKTILKSIPPNIWFAAALGGGTAMALEIVWARLGSLLIGGSVYAMAVVLSVFLAGIAFGAELGRRWGAKALGPGLVAIGFLAVVGTIVWRVLPHGLGMAWEWGGASSLLPAGALFIALAMAGAPIASGVVFSACLQSVPDGKPEEVAGQVLAANTLGGVIGIILGGYVGLPWLGIRGTVLLISLLSISCAFFFPFKWKTGTSITLFALFILSPMWDPAIYSVGIYNRIDRMDDRSPRAIERFAHRGWDLLFYRDGTSASVAVGQSKRSGNLWLSINGKVDASTGGDMPTQQLSGQLPVLIADHQNPEAIPALVIGLASGITAAETFAAGATDLTILELEPAVVEASDYFKDYNHEIVQHPRTNLIVGDARAHLAQTDALYRVIISEPSNPWITGVSNLFTVEYWRLGRARLHQDGVFCQWIQLYNMPPEAFRSLIQSFVLVFPNAWLFETIPGADVLLIAAPSLPAELPLKPLLGPEELQELARGAPLNTDDRPWVEFEAPKWLNRSTGTLNKNLLYEYVPKPK
ncbi:MAG: hypothetical protein VX278_13290 [Myxococcota bacterium]|nr:hypothetical protein [Myxococcota bacterium]